MGVPLPPPGRQQVTASYKRLIQDKNEQVDELLTDDPTENRKIETDQWRWQTLHEYSSQYH